MDLNATGVVPILGLDHGVACFTHSPEVSTPACLADDMLGAVSDDDLDEAVQCMPFLLLFSRTSEWFCLRRVHVLCEKKCDA